MSAWDALQMQLALNEFYSGSDSAKRRKAHDYLLAIPKDEYSCRGILDLLNRTEDAFIYFYAANYLADLLRCQWPERMDHCLLEVRDGLLKACSERKMCREVYGGHLKMLHALALCVLRTAPDIWPDSFEELCSFFLPLNMAEDLCTTVACLPEEFFRFSCRPERRMQIRLHLASCQRQILKMLEQIYPAGQEIQQAHYSLIRAALCCASEWLQLTTNLDGWENVISHYLGFFENNHLFQAVCQFYEDLVQHSSTPNYPSLIEKMFRYCHQVGQKFLSGHQPMDVMSMGSLVTNTVSIINSTVECHTFYVLEHLTDNEYVLNAMDTLLMATQTCGQYPLDEQISCIPLESWFSLYMDVSQMSNYLKQPWWPVVKRIYERLFEILLRKIRYDSRLVSIAGGGCNDWEMYEEYRATCGEVLQACYKLLGHEISKRSAESLQVVLSAPEGSVDWMDAEALLFYFCSVGELVTISDAVHVEQYVIRQLLPTVPRNSFVINTTLCMFRNVVHIVEEFDLYEQAVHWVILGLSKKATLSNAVVALTELCQSNKERVARWSSGLEQAFLIWLDNDQVDPGKMPVVSCFANVLSSRPVHEAIPVLQRVLLPSVRHLQSACSGQAGVDKNDTLYHLQYMTAFLQSLYWTSGVPPDLLGTMCNLVESLYRTTEGDSEIALELTNLLNAILKICQDQVDVLMNVCGQAVVTFLPQNPCVISFATKLFQLLPWQEETTNFICTIFSAITERVVGKLHGSNAVVDVMDYYAPLLMCIVKRYPNLVDAAQLSMCQAVEATMVGLTCDESGALPLTCKFLSVLMKHSEKPAVQQIVRQYGSSIVQFCWRRLETEMLSSSVDYLCDVLFIIYKMYGSMLPECFAHVPNHEKASLMLKSVDNKRLFVHSAKSYNMSCRLGSISKK